MPTVEIPVEKWAGKIREVKLGGNGRKSVVVGGENTLPFLSFEGSLPNKPAIAIEVLDKMPADWSPHLVSAWGDVLKDSALWAKKAAEYGADIISLRLKSAHPEEGNTGAEQAKKNVSRVLEATDLPLIVLGPEVVDKDNEVIIAASEVGKGQRLAIGDCFDKNYRTIAAVAIADGHAVIAKTPIDINLAKQLSILLSDVGIAADSIIIDPTTGALGYGIEYSYSVMERLKLAALTGDSMTQMPMICTVGEESWRQKESKFVTGLPASWGEHEPRSVTWEILTATILLNAGANIIVLRHPRTIEVMRGIISKLYEK